MFQWGREGCQGWSWCRVGGMSLPGVAGGAEEGVSITLEVVRG